MENTKMIGVALSILFTAICTIGIYAQTSNSQYVISAKAGGVNYTSGDVKTTRKDTTEALIVSIQDTLENGDQIQTGPDGRAEILLNPGSYLRLSENSTLEFTDTSFDSLRVKLRSGTAIVEVAGDDLSLRMRPAPLGDEARGQLARHGLITLRTCFDHQQSTHETGFPTV